MELFIREGNKINVAFNEIYIYPEFEAILKKYGKDSNVLNQILHYIYFVASPKSLANQKGYTPKEAHKYACKQSKLSEKFEIDNSIKDAIKLYKDYSSNAMIEYIETIVRSLRTGSKLCTKILDKNEEVDTDSKESLSSAIDSINSVLTLSSKINSSIPSLINNIKELKELEEKETAESGGGLRGSGEAIPDSYDGISEIEEDD